MPALLCADCPIVSEAREKVIFPLVLNALCIPRCVSKPFAPLLSKSGFGSLHIRLV